MDWSIDGDTRVVGRDAYLRGRERLDDGDRDGWRTLYEDAYSEWSDAAWCAGWILESHAEPLLRSWWWRQIIRRAGGMKVYGDGWVSVGEFRARFL